MEEKKLEKQKKQTFSEKLKEHFFEFNTIGTGVAIYTMINLLIK